MAEYLVPVGVSVVTGLAALLVAFANGWFKRKAEVQTKEEAYTDRVVKRLEHVESNYDQRAEKMAAMSVRIAELSAQNKSMTAALESIKTDFERLQGEFQEVQTAGRMMLAFIQHKQIYAEFLAWEKEHKSEG